MAGVLVDDEPRADDGRQQSILIRSRAERAPRALHDEGGRRDRAELAGEVLLEEPFERRPPHPCRDLEALLHDSIQVRRRHRLGQGALLELADEGGIDRVCQLRDGDPQLFYIHSCWKDEAAFEHHAGLPHTVRFLERMGPLIDHPLDVARTARIA
ncbi:MAG: putative quinol monooxygenase [Candidatus Rokuibacteriota bacterium]